ncbi:hypothetical protein B0H14DRAFT_3657747 [Mycena olivaceomarginata]|nr:hypothetical protein B0H14DRAFT_3657747 [Mycena olivaceomarginata]
MYTTTECDEVTPSIGTRRVAPAVPVKLNRRRSFCNVAGTVLAKPALHDLQPFAEHLPSDLQLIDAVGTPEYPHQHSMRVDEETDRTALGGSKLCSEQPLHLHNHFLSAGKQGLIQPYMTEVCNLLLVILAAHEDNDHPEVRAWWYTITRSSIEVLGPDTLARKQAGATLGVGKGKRAARWGACKFASPPVSTPSADVEYVGAPSPVEVGLSTR